jgi:transcriptional regulator with XRE-family HTH domain
MTKDARLFPALLRHWRARRGLSQLDLALAADVSARHVSFLETGRAHPSRDMVLRLGATLGVPLRDQNALLQAAGYAPAFPEPQVGELPGPITQAIERMLAQQEPFPMTVLDRTYGVVRVNAAAKRTLLQFVKDPAAMTAPPNVFALLFDPALARTYIQEWERVAHTLVGRLHREVLARPEDGDLSALLESLFRYPGVPGGWRQPDFSLPSEPTLELRFRKPGLDLGFLTTIAVFNAPQNVTLEELRIESYFPLDERTARECRRLSVATGGS